MKSLHNPIVSSTSTWETTSNSNSNSSSTSSNTYNIPTVTETVQDQQSHKVTHSSLIRLQKLQSPTNSYLNDIIFIFLICSSQFITLASASQAILQMDSLSVWFKIPPTSTLQLGWVNASFAMTCGAFIILAGKLCDILNPRIIFISGYVWFSLWTLITGFASYVPKNMIFLYICRGCQGIGGALLFPSALILLNQYYTVPEPSPSQSQSKSPTTSAPSPSHDIEKNLSSDDDNDGDSSIADDSDIICTSKSIAFSLYGACAPLGIVIGGIFSAIFTQLATWPWNYWSMSIVTTLLSILSYFYVVVPIPVEKLDSNPNSLKNWKNFDFLGVILGISALILFGVSWDQATMYKFKTIHVYLTLLFSLVSFIAMIIWEYYFNNPIIPIRQIHPGTIKALLVVFFSYISFTQWLFYTWKLFTEVKDNSPILGSVKFIPLSVAGIISATFSILLIVKRVPVQIRLLAGASSFLLSHILLLTCKLDSSYWTYQFFSIISISIGLDISFPSATLLLTNGIPPEIQGICAALVGSVLNYGTAIGPPIAQTIIQYQCESCMSDPHDKKAFLKGIHIAGAVGVGCSGIAVLIGIYGTITEYSWKTKGFSKKCIK
ncbi:uncharacterized protein NDAI_0K02730 [Naumovozyma dairenensis CBS 421]|uniref:Major facilitator superfamily (MFS) profile domain-containing protein n=1 Tax=Naumovozyma dairenensis (strain ATCC 10597 / BCRC 20456 / CBS 421 / NBRC 0211 / NRRL Y-12639) TaxID=1071378 RepID=G0WI53_NAUDC|nr:hypothetical protein NDAI_0K02730 [Naumovozyma dairenensis CBS 421]CCD27464.1 hypothetical protein NDAI_0K02730 [Naumovozyma dairenensis CBS 421]